MKITSAVEDYLKAIHNLAHPADGSVQTVSTSTLAERLGVAAPSVSAMLARTDAAGLTNRRSRAVSLTAQGEAIALKVVRRHRLVEMLLYEKLGVPWDEVHEEAELIEHAISDRLEQYLDRAMGYPTHDPHGDPIPNRQGSFEPEDRHQVLADAPPGAQFVVRRVSDEDPEVLRYLADHHILPDVTLTVIRRDPFGGPSWLQIPEHAAPHPLPEVLAQHIFGDLSADIHREPPPPDGP